MTDPGGPIDAVSPADAPPAAPILSVCVCLKNRSKILHEGRELTPLPDLVRCLADAASDLLDVGPVELVVADFHSDDRPLSEWLAEAAGRLRVRVVPVDGGFSRGRGLNRAVAEAASRRLFLTDADMLIRPAVLLRAIEIIDRSHAWFPICRFFDEAGDPAFWNTNGFGIVALDRAAFDASGGVPEFDSWGHEDGLFFERLSLHVALERGPAEGLDHQWHPRDVRFDHYARPLRSDFQQHLLASAREGPWGPPVRTLFVDHPDWAGELHLYENGRMARPGIDGGEYVLENRRRLILRWERWPAATLEWDETDRAYRDRARRLALREAPLDEGDPGARRLRPSTEPTPPDRADGARVPPARGASR
jgi:glycosyltransferase involved in cell wall biosynthesis